MTTKKFPPEVNEVRLRRYFEALEEYRKSLVDAHTKTDIDMLEMLPSIRQAVIVLKEEISDFEMAVQALDKCVNAARILDILLISGQVDPLKCSQPIDSELEIWRSQIINRWLSKEI